MDMFWVLAAGAIAGTLVCGVLLWRQLDRRAAPDVLQDREKRPVDMASRLPPD